MLQHLSLVIRETRAEFSKFAEGVQAGGDGATYSLEAFKRKASLLGASLTDAEVLLLPLLRLLFAVSVVVTYFSLWAGQ